MATAAQNAFLTAADTFARARAAELGLVVPPPVVVVPPPLVVTPGATNPVVWFQFGSNEPTQAICDDAISRKPRYILIQPWWTTTAAYFKSKFPACKVIGYKDMLSSRSDAESLGNSGPCGVTYSQSQSSGWLTGTVMSGYTSQAVVKTWQVDYQTAWTTNVMKWLADNPHFDGVFADNLVSPTADYYGTGQNEQQLSDGCLALVRMAGPQIVAKGKIMMPNITDGRMNPGFFAAGSAPGGGGCDEMFAVWPGGGYNTDPSSQIAEGGVPGVFIARANATDSKGATYAFACFLLAADPQGAFYACDFNQYNVPLIWYPVYGMNVGSMTSGMTNNNGVLSRQFSNGVVYVNTTGNTANVTLSGAYKKVDGGTVSGNYSIPGTTGVVLVRS